MDLKKETWIYWKWKDNPSYSKYYIQGLVETDKGTLLELSDSAWWTNYPIRVLVSDIDILKIKKD